MSDSYAGLTALQENVIKTKEHVEGVRSALDTAKQNVFQYTTMVSPSADQLNRVVQFVGTTSGSYTHGYFYTCESDGSGGYQWTEIEFGSIGDFLEEVAELPTATASNVGHTYILVAPQTGYKLGGIYQNQSDGENPPTYSWVLISSSNLTAGNAIDITNDQINVKVDDDTIHIDGTSNEAYVDNTIRKQFIGTQAQWDALSSTEQEKYPIVNITDNIDYTGNIDAVPTQNSPNAVSSGGVYTALQNVGGHTIIDQDGNTMPSRKKLKFIGMKVADDAINDTTIISDDYFGSFSPTIWLNKAGLDFDNYGSISGVLADELAVRKLFTIHKSVDYFAENYSEDADVIYRQIISNDIVAKWVSLRDYAMDKMSDNSDVKGLMDEFDKYGYGEWALVNQIPIMTSNTAPYGVASASVEDWANRHAWNAIDGGVANYTSGYHYWVCQNSGWWQYEFVEAKAVRKITATLGATTSTQTYTYKIQYSNDGVHFTDATDVIEATGLVIELDYDVNFNAKYVRFVFLSVTGSSSNWIAFTNVKMYAWQPKGNIPIMTSNTSPYGEAITTSEHSATYAAWKAFNGTPSGETDRWSSASGVTDAGIGYRFTNSVCVKRVKYYIRNQALTSDIAQDCSAVIQASNDGTTWIDIKTFSITAEMVIQENIVDVNNAGFYLYYRFKFLSAPYRSAASTDYCGMTFLQFYGRELKVSVPTMTSNTSPYGVAFYSGDYTTVAAAYLAFDNSISTESIFAYVNGAAFLGYGFTTPTKITKFAVSNRNSATTDAFATYKLQASDDNITWKDVSSTKTQAVTTAQYIQYNDADLIDGAYKYYRIYTDGVNTSGRKTYINVSTIQFYGLDYSEYDWDSERPRTYIYDHGLELKSLVQTTSGTFIVDRLPYEIKMTSGNETATSVLYLLHTANTIDLTNFTYLFANYVDYLSTTSSGNTEIMSIGLNSQPEGDGNTAETRVYLPITNTNVCLNVSSITEPMYIRFRIKGYGWVVQTAFNEWWLE